MTQSSATHREAAQWVYRGLWSWLVRWLRVPDQPPTLPANPGQLHESFQPSREFLSYMKFNFWLALTLSGGSLLTVWAILLFAKPMIGIALTAPIWGIVLVPSIIAYVAIHLRYDTMWYVVTDRSMRVRRGLWSIHEVTITFENVQTVKVSQGPLQRWFGIGNVEVRTAGGGMVQTGQGGQIEGSGHHGVIEGVTNAGEIRDLILAQLKLAKTTGLGDEIHAHVAAKPLVASIPSNIRAEHLALLREIRDELARA
jgi:membrane protein YdbS with pleckstrin-like domain